MVSLRPALGRLGSLLPTALNVLQLVGWTAFEIIVMGEAAAKISGPFLGSMTKLFWMALFTAWCTLLAVGGPLAVVRQWLEKFGIWMVYASTIWITYQLATAGIPTLSSPGPGMPLPLALDLVVAMPVSWMPLVSDYNRFARRPRSGFLGTFAGYTLANTWFYALGAGLALSTGSEDVVTPILTLLYGNLALILILVDETDNAFADIYSASVSIQNAFRASHWKLAVTVAAVSFTVAAVTPITQYENFLLMIGGVFVPLFGVLIADSLGRNYDLNDFYEKAPSLNPRGLVAWLIGAATYFAIAYGYPDLGATIPSLAISFATHMLLARRLSGNGLA